MNKPYTDKELRYFVKESNKIEGILRQPTKAELIEAERFLNLDIVRIDDLVSFVQVYQPDAILRDRAGLDVRVGNHIAPRGGPEIVGALHKVIDLANDYDSSPWATHNAYETLHPFTDGNGRSGRILWAWQMVNQDCWPFLRLGFLHAHYYQTLSGARKGL